MLYYYFKMIGKFMKVALYFKDIRLGELTFLNKEFVYNSNLEGENRAKVFPSMLLYGLPL